MDNRFANYNNRQYEIEHAAVAASSSGNNELVAAPGTGLRIVLINYLLSASGAVNAKFRSANTDKTGLIYFAAAGDQARNGYGAQVVCARNEALNLNLSGNVAVGGHIAYIVTKE